MDKLKDKLKTAAIVLAAVDGGKVQIAAGVTADSIGKVKAGDLVNFVAQQVGGKGGGKPDMAMAGGTDAAQAAGGAGSRCRAGSPSAHDGLRPITIRRATTQDAAAFARVMGDEEVCRHAAGAVHERGDLARASPTSRRRRTQARPDARRRARGHGRRQRRPAQSRSCAAATPPTSASRSRAKRRGRASAAP